MVTSIPALTPEEQIEFGYTSEVEPWPADRTSLVVASYNIRYARGPFLISGGLLRKARLLSTRHRARTVLRNITVAAKSLTSGELMPPIDILGLQEADKET